MGTFRRAGFHIAVLLAVSVPALAGPPPATVFAWFPRSIDNWDTSAIDWGAITHICYRAVIIRPDGTVRPGPQATADRVEKLVNEAHAHGVKVSVLVWGTDAAGSSRYLARSAERAARSLLEYATFNRLDGINIDDETWEEGNTVTKGPNRDLVTGFFRTIRATFTATGRPCHLSWASPAVISPDDKYGVSWPDFASISSVVDAFAVMTYTMVPPTIGWTGSAQPVRGGGWVGSHRRDFETTIQDYLAATGDAKSKLLLGIDTWRGGTEWKCRTAKPLSIVTSKPKPLSATEAVESATRYGRRFDQEQKSPWYVFPYYDVWRQGWYEDDESFAAKLDLAREYRLGGVCLWAIDGESEPASEFRLIRQRFAPAY